MPERHRSTHRQEIEIPLQPGERQFPPHRLPRHRPFDVVNGDASPHRFNPDVVPAGDGYLQPDPPVPVPPRPGVVRPDGHTRGGQLHLQRRVVPIAPFTEPSHKHRIPGPTPYGDPPSRLEIDVNFLSGGGCKFLFEVGLPRGADEKGGKHQQQHESFHCAAPCVCGVTCSTSSSA